MSVRVNLGAGASMSEPVDFGARVDTSGLVDLGA